MTSTKSQETVRSRVEAVCDRYIERYEKVVAQFLETATTNPLHAIEWQTATLAEAVEPYRDAYRLKEAFSAEGADEEAIIANTLKYIADERKYFDGVTLTRSTNPIANEIENRQKESRMKMLFSRYGGLFRDLEDAINDR